VFVTGACGSGAAPIKIQKAADGTYNVAEFLKTPNVGAHTQPPVL
jgi:hypothetical protein